MFLFQIAALLQSYKSYATKL